MARKADATGAVCIPPWPGPHPASVRWNARPGRDGDGPVPGDLPGRIPVDEPIGSGAPATRAVTTQPSARVAPSRSSGGTGTGGRGKRTARLRVSATRGCAPPDIPAGRCGNAGQAAAPRRRIEAKMRCPRAFGERIVARDPTPRTAENPQPHRPHDPLRRRRHRQAYPRGLASAGHGAGASARGCAPTAATGRPDAWPGGPGRRDTVAEPGGYALVSPRGASLRRSQIRLVFVLPT